MSLSLINRIKSRIEKEFRENSDPRLHYHNLVHTLDVFQQSVKIAGSEGIKDPGDLFLLQTAALYHDIGCLYGHRDHEARSCEILRKDKDLIQFTEKQLNTLYNLIFATKIPQVPASRLEEILCDADIDYLGRKDFKKFSNCLRKEFLEFHIVNDERHWQETQIRFFENHHYFTETSQKLRNPLKTKYFEELKKEFERF